MPVVPLLALALAVCCVSSGIVDRELPGAFFLLVVAGFVSIIDFSEGTVCQVAGDFYVVWHKVANRGVVLICCSIRHSLISNRAKGQSSWFWRPLEN